MSKNLLVLGIGPAQVDLINAAKELGMKVFACAYEADGPGKALLDGFKQADVKDIETIKQYAIEQKIDFIYSMALEVAVPTITKVSEELGLPNFFSSESLVKLENKAVWRKTLGNIKGNVATHSGQKLDDFEEWSIYPAIIKPVDSSGQRGVYKVGDFEDVKKVFSDSIQHSRSGALIIEDYVEGPEISVNSFMYQGELVFAAVSDRVSYEEYPGGIIKEHHLPTRIMTEEMEKDVYALVHEVNTRMGFENGHIYFQMKVDKEGAKLIEFTPRFDGCHMWRLIQSGMAIDLRKAALETLAYGQSQELETYNKQKVSKNVKTKFISDKPGTIVDRASYNLPDKPLYLQWYYEDGQPVKKITGYLEKVGFFIVAE